jgi:hypothetical protein
MAIANYVDLQASVANWLARSDLTTVIPDFIVIAEANFNRTLRTLQQETKDAAFSISTEYVAVPTGFLEARSMYLNTSPARSLSYLSADLQTDSNGWTGRPTGFSLTGSNFRFSPAPDATYTATLIYYKAIPALASNSTNWLLTAHPDAYLYGSLIAASGYIQDDGRVAGIKALYEQVIAEIKGSDNKNRWGGNNMRIRAA